MDILHLNSLSDAFVWQDSLGLITKELGKAAGSEKVYVNIDSVPPNGYSTRYHSHSQQEEFFLVLEGSGILRINDTEVPITKGSFFAKPAGKGIAHTFFNSGTVPLQILDVGTTEPEDTCYYPDEKMYMQKSNQIRRIFHEESLDKKWYPHPNPDAAE